MIPKKQTLIISLILILIVSGIIIGVIYHSAKEIKKNYSALLSEKREIVLLKIKAENLIKFQEQYLIFHERLDEINEVFIDSETPINFLQFLEKIADDVHLPIEISIGAVKESKLDIWPSLSFQIITKGDPNKVFKFINKIDNSPFLIEIETLNMVRLNQNDIESNQFESFSVGDLNVNLLAKVYTK